MNPEQDTSSTPSPDEAPPQAPVQGSRASGVLLFLLGVLVLLALASSGLLWQRLLAVQTQLSDQGTDATTRTIEARTLARQAQEQVRDATVRLGVMEARLSEISMQSAQIEEMRQNLSRTRDETLAIDLESALHLALQQAQLMGSVQPLQTALQAAELRVQRAGLARLNPVLHAIARDLAKVKAVSASDTPVLLGKLDELSQLLDELPLLNSMVAEQAAPSAAAPAGDMAALWQRSLQVLGEKLKSLVRISRIDNPEAALMSPEQSFFLRENLKLKLLNARIELLMRQDAAVRADLAAVAISLSKYFDPASPQTRAARELLQQVRSQVKVLVLPQPDDTLAALAKAAAGK